MSFRTRTAWLEIAAGFQTLFAAVSAFETVGASASTGPFWTSRLFASALLLASCAIFMLHGLRPIRRARQACFVFAATVSLSASAWFAFGGQVEQATLQGLLGLWFLAAFLFVEADFAPTVVGERSPSALNFYVASVFAILAAVFVARGTFAPIVEAVALLAAALLLCWSEKRGNQRWRIMTALVAGAAAAVFSAIFFQRGASGTAGAFLSLFAMLLLSVSFIGGLPETADELAGTTLRQREIYLYERAIETTLWIILALSALYMNFLERFDARQYFVALLTAAAVTQYAFRFRTAKAISERRYLFALIGEVAVSILLISAAGGAFGPFMYFAYLAVYAGTVIIAPVWSIVTAGAYVAYMLTEFFSWWLTQGTAATADELGQRAAATVFLSSTLLMTGLYAVWTGRRRTKSERAILAANRQLAEALKSAINEREQTKRQAEELQQLNDDLMEMRSALMNVLEDVEESKRLIEVDRRRDTASLDALGEGVIAAERDGKIFLCNPAGASLLGLETASIIGQPIDRVIRLFQEDSDILHTQEFENAFAGRASVLGSRLMLMREDGRRVPVSGTVAPYLDETNQLAGVVAALRDVTVERSIDRQKSDFITIASHQLRTPLTAMRWIVDLLLGGDAGDLMPKQKEYLSDMAVSNARMIKLVGDLLDVGRFESGRQKSDSERVAVAPFTEELLREFKPLIKSQGVTFSSEVAVGALEFRADPALVRQALSNILENAIKYTPKGGDVALSVRPDGDMVVFTVKDTGVGIPQKQQYRVYDKFFRGENVVTKETVGSGLGLYVTRRIIELSNGRTWFESQEGVGTTFSVALPIAAPKGTMAA